MSALTGDNQQAVDAAWREAARRGKAIDDAMAPPDMRRSDEEAFGALLLAIKTAAAKRSESEVKLSFTNGRGVLSKAFRDYVIFYLNDGFLIFSIFPLPGLKVIPYVRKVGGRILDWYEFSLDGKKMNEFEVADSLIDLVR